MAVPDETPKGHAGADCAVATSAAAAGMALAHAADHIVESPAVAGLVPHAHLGAEGDDTEPHRTDSAAAANLGAGASRNRTDHAVGLPPAGLVSAPATDLEGAGDLAADLATVHAGVACTQALPAGHVAACTGNHHSYALAAAAADAADAAAAEKAHAGVDYTEVLCAGPETGTQTGSQALAAVAGKVHAGTAQAVALDAGTHHGWAPPADSGQEHAQSCHAAALPAGHDCGQAPAADSGQMHAETHHAVAVVADAGEVHARSDHTVAQLADPAVMPAHTDCTSAEPVGTSTRPARLAVQTATFGVGTKCRCHWNAQSGV